jgi:hypothetical protein
LENALSGSCSDIVRWLADFRFPNPFFVDSVVALGRSDARAPGQPPVWVAEASGFLYGFAADAETDPAKHMYEVYLVTNRHVFQTTLRSLCGSIP